MLRMPLKNFLENNNVAETGYYYLLSKNGVIIAHPNKELINQDVSSHKFVQKILETESGTIKYKWENTTKIAGYTYIQPLDAILVGTATTKELLGTIKADIIRKTIIVGFLSIITATLLLNILFRRTIVTPINKLERFIEKISAGDLTAECKLIHQDEIGSIGNHMNKMSLNINTTLLDVRDASKKCQKTILKNSPDPVISCRTLSKLNLKEQEM